MKQKNIYEHIYRIYSLNTHENPLYSEHMWLKAKFWSQLWETIYRQDTTSIEHNKIYQKPRLVKSLKKMKYSGPIDTSIQGTYLQKDKYNL